MTRSETVKYTSYQAGQLSITQLIVRCLLGGDDKNHFDLRPMD